MRDQAKFSAAIGIVLHNKRYTLDVAKFFQHVRQVVNVRLLSDVRDISNHARVINVANDVERNGWVCIAFTGTGYIPNAVEFDGSSSIVHTSATGFENSDAFLMSFWIKPTTEAADFQMILNANTGTQDRLNVALDNGSNNTNDLWTIYIQGMNASGAQVIEYESDELLATDQWNHVLISVDASASALEVYINDVLDTNYISVTPANGDINLNINEYAAGEFAGGGDTLIAGLSQLWFETNTYLDLSVQANRRNFIDADGNPVYLGADGSLPTGSAPDIFLSGDTADWHTNKGTGGGFTENGALTTSTTSPYTPAGGGGGCSNPTGATGEIIYNSSEGLFQGCTPDGWFAFHQ